MNQTINLEDVLLYCETCRKPTECRRKIIFDYDVCCEECHSIIFTIHEKPKSDPFDTTTVIEGKEYQ